MSLSNCKTLLEISWGHRDGWGQNRQSNKKEAAACDKQAYDEYFENKEQFHEWITKSTSDSDVTHSADVSYFT